MTTTTAPSLANEDDVRLATECIDWHRANCAVCTTGATCRAAAENMAFLEGMGYNERSADHAPAARTGNRPAAGSPAKNQYGTSTVAAASEAQLRFLTKLLAERDVAGITELQNSVLVRGLKARQAGTVNKRQASDMIDILTQCPVRVTATTIAAPAGNGPSDKQVAFYARLAAERAVELTSEQFARLDKRAASAAIDAALAAPRRAAEVAQVEELAAGIYQVGDRVYKVQRAVHGSGKMTAKLLVVDEATKTATFEYKGLATRFIPAGTAPMTLEQAKAFGALYGVCCNCGATLTDEKSIEAGIGPVCAKRFA